MRHALLIGLGLFVICASAAVAQQPQPIPVGSRVRVTFTDGASGEASFDRATGTLVGLDDDALTLLQTPTGPPLVLPRSGVAGMELSLRRGNRGKGALIGLGVGAGTGFLLGMASGDDDEGFLRFRAEEKGTIVAVVLAPVGALIGLLASSGEQWRPVSVGQVTLGLGPEARRADGVFVCLRF